MAAGRPPVDRSVPPPAGEIRPFRFPPVLRSRLPNGLAVATARLTGLPLVSLELVAPAAAQYDPPERSGIATLTASVLDEGTARRSALEIAASAERLGGYVSAGADWDVGYLATGLLSSHRREGLELLAEIVTAPTFPAAEVERLRRQRIAEILRRRQDPSALADDRLQRQIYGGTVYAQPLHGSEETLRAARPRRAARLLPAPLRLRRLDADRRRRPRPRGAPARDRDRVRRRRPSRAGAGAGRRSSRRR